MKAVKLPKGWFMKDVNKAYKRMLQWRQHPLTTPKRQAK